MERLQAAIEKARAQRQARQPAQRPVTPGDRAAAAAAAGATGTAAAPGSWDTIVKPEFRAAHLRRNRVVATHPGPESSAYDMLRTKIVQLSRQNNWKRVAVTSPDKNAGKSTTCCNLLASFARQSDRRTILMDLDMRRPSIASILGHSGEHGVEAVLEGRVPFHEQAVRFSDSAAISMNYHPIPNSTEILLRDQTAQILNEIEKTYHPDTIIFDMPPMMVADDTLAFLKNVDCALLVAGAESTTVDQIDSCEKEIAGQTNVLGVVLNKCHHMDSEYGYDYY